MSDYSDECWQKVIASFIGEPIAANHFVKVLWPLRDTLDNEQDRQVFDDLINALFPYTLFFDACRHLYWQYLHGRLDPADDPISAACYYAIWPNGPRDPPQSESERLAHRVWKVSGRPDDLPRWKKRKPRKQPHS